jgi:hypothetical protein
VSSSGDSERPGAGADAPSGVVFWIGAVLGIGIMVFGIRGLFEDSRATQPLEFSKWFIGADILHDLVIAPVAALVGVFVARLLPRPWRLPVQAGLFASAIVLAVGWAPLRGYGRATAIGNATVQPLDYSTAVATVVGVVWIIIACWLGMIALGRSHGGARVDDGSDPQPAESHRRT